MLLKSIASSSGVDPGDGQSDAPTADRPTDHCIIASLFRRADQQTMSSQPSAPSGGGGSRRGGGGRGRGRGGRGRGRGRGGKKGGGGDDDSNKQQQQQQQQPSSNALSSADLESMGMHQLNLSDLSAGAAEFVPPGAGAPQQQEGATAAASGSKKAGGKGTGAGSKKKNNSKSKKKGGGGKGAGDEEKQSWQESAEKDDGAPSKNKKADKQSTKKKSDTSGRGGDAATGSDGGRTKKGGKKGKSAAAAASSESSAKAPLQPAIPPSQPQTTNPLSYGKGAKISVVHIAEKPSIAQAIAAGLSSMKGSAPCGFGGGGRSLPTHDIPHLPFPKAPHAERCSHKITSVAGHVFGTDFGSEYQSWDSVDPAELFHAPIVKKAQKGSVVKHLQTEARGCDFVVLWLDCDREGENIAFEVLDCIMHLMKSGGDSGVANYDRVYRAYFSAINPSDISKAYGLLGKPDKCQSLSVDARQELDLKVGVAFSRFQTRYFQGRYGDLDSAVLSYGPCQTPTLGFCVQRHIEIETFKPTPYWVLDLGVLKRGRMCRAQWASGRSFNQAKTNSLVQLCKDTPGVSAEVLSVVTKDKKQGRPTPLNTVQMLKAASKALGMGPHQAMQCAERLYLVSYFVRLYDYLIKKMTGALLESMRVF